MSDPVTRGSIRRRLLWSLLLSAALLALAVYFLVLSVARQVAQDSQDNVLAASALSIIDSARYSGGQVSLDLPYSALSMLDSVTDERVFYAIRFDGEFLSGYEDLPQADGESSATTFLSAPFLGEEVRIATVRRSLATDISQGLLEVSVAQTLSGQRQTLAQITRSSVVIGSGFFAVCVLLAVLIARSTIQPLALLAASVSRRGPADLRPVTAPVPSEMAPLVGSLNTLMRRLRASLSRSEDFIAEAAHRVRTPLAIVRTKAEILARKSDRPEIDDAVRDMIHAIDESSRAAGQLLDHAMVTFRLDDLAKEIIDLPQLAQESVERVRPTSELKDILLSFGRLDPATVTGDPILLQNALHNVLDNAIKYAPTGSKVTVSIERDNACAVLNIADSGSGFPDRELASMADRFARGVNAKGVVGSGLGLTIVKDVVTAHGGDLRISNIEGGGACVSLLLPVS